MLLKQFAIDSQTNSSAMTIHTSSKFEFMAHNSSLCNSKKSDSESTFNLSVANLIMCSILLPRAEEEAERAAGHVADEEEEEDGPRQNPFKPIKVVE